MAKPTLLDIVQDILNDMDSDQVNSIVDTEEAEQVAQIVKTTYSNMINSRNWPHTRKLFRLNSSGDAELPTHMTFDQDVKAFESIFYNRRNEDSQRDIRQELRWMYPDDFLRYTNQRSTENQDVKVVTDPSGVKLQILTDKPPTYYTSFDDETIIFDSYESVLESTLQADNTQAIAYTVPSFTIEDTFIPDLPIEGFGELIETAKVRAQAKLRQFEDRLSLAEAGSQKRWNARNAWTVNGGVRYPDYGRRRNRYFRDPTLRQDEKDYR